MPHMRVDVSDLHHRVHLPVHLRVHSPDSQHPQRRDKLHQGSSDCCSARGWEHRIVAIRVLLSAAKGSSIY
jgi:hypothetical protein